MRLSDATTRPSAPRENLDSAANAGVNLAARMAGASAAPKIQPDSAATARQRAFDPLAAERAELDRELDVIEALLLAQLKQEDEIVNKWIAMI